MKIHIDKNDEKKQLHYKGTALGLLKKLKISSESVIVTRKKGDAYELLTEDDVLEDKDLIKIVYVVSGG